MRAAGIKKRGQGDSSTLLGMTIYITCHAEPVEASPGLPHEKYFSWGPQCRSDRGNVNHSNNTNVNIKFSHRSSYHTHNQKRAD